MLRTGTDEKERNGVDYALNMLQEQRDSASKERAAEIVAAVKTLHVAEMSIGTKVSFVKRFSGDREYIYLALKVANQIGGEERWYVTGKESPLTNERFENLLAEKLGFENFQILHPINPMTGLRPPQPETWKGWGGAPDRLFGESKGKGWGADVNPAPTSGKPTYDYEPFGENTLPKAPLADEPLKGWQGAPSTHAVGPADPNEE